MGVSAPDAAGGLLRGRYRLGPLIARGGVASVYRAHDEHLGRDVAVKLFEANATTLGDIRRQESEVKVLASLNHHSLVTLHDAGLDETEPGQPQVYLVMELVDGANLRDTLNQGPLSSRHIAQIGYDLAEGLEYIHDHGVVHRDVKPANILLAEYSNDSRARAKLTDFGIALPASGERLTTDGTTSGTAAYLSPEQAKADVVGPASDVYSLGLVLLECFTGELAFPGLPVQSALARLLNDPEVPDTLAPEWRELLTAMTARDPDKRPLTRDLVLALRQAVITETGRHAADTATLPTDEEGRLAAVRRLDILDTPPDGAFDRITALAARSFSAPISIISFVDQDRVWFKSHHGLAIDQVDMEFALRASEALNQDPPWIGDAIRVDPLALTNPRSGNLGLQFYVGVPLRTREGYHLGTLCVLDFEPRTVTEKEIATLNDLAALVINELELRLENGRVADDVEPRQSSG
ncbi:MAG: eukaryotic-like serine/threonine-protein kinase [Microbacteriaceae bacterium]|nr:eukaryotic-like serine/threonine-protein kinase [Microbacteriaceae bacterium]